VWSKHSAEAKSGGKSVLAKVGGAVFCRHATCFAEGEAAFSTQARGAARRRGRQLSQAGGFKQRRGFK
jgi:hypothetical protein